MSFLIVPCQLALLLDGNHFDVVVFVLMTSLLRNGCQQAAGQADWAERRQAATHFVNETLYGDDIYVGKSSFEEIIVQKQEHIFIIALFCQFFRAL